MPPKPTNPRTINLREQPKANVDLPTRPKSSTPPKQSPKLKPTKKPRNKKKLVLLALTQIMFVSGIYIGFLLVAPLAHKKSPQEIYSAAAAEPTEDRIFVPSLGINAKISEGNEAVLDKGEVWHRKPQNGNPQSGGNTILTAHSFVWSIDPGRLIDQSVFYHLSSIRTDAEIIIHSKKKQYKYKVVETKRVAPNAIEVENFTTQPQLTLYTCTPAGSADGRVVAIARPVD